MATRAPDLVEVSDRTQFDSFASFARYNPRVVVRDEGPLLLVRTDLPIAFFNAAFVRGPVADPVGIVEEAKAFFGERQLPWRLSVRLGVADDVAMAAVHAGLRPGEPMEGMTLHPLLDDEPALPAGLEIEVVTDEATLTANQAVAAGGFGMPIEIARALMPPAVIGSEDLIAFTARVDGIPAATSVLIRTGEIAGIYNVATLPDYRRRGLAIALTKRALAEGARRGCTIGALQPSDAGRPVYLRIGFQPAALYLQFSTPPNPV